MIADAVFLRRLEQLRRFAQRVGRGGRGEHQSRHRGAGLELADHRAYAAGDDPRRLDWNAFARLERPLLRLFHADENLPTYILVDVSASMRLGAPPKLEQAVRLAAALAYLAACALDPVTVLPFSTRLARLEETAEASGGKRQIPGLFEQLSRLQATGTTDLDAAVTAFLSRQRPRGLVVVLSDFLGGGPVERALLRLRHARHVTTVVQITAAEDRHVPAVADEEIVAVDVETGVSRVVAIGPETRTVYEQAVLTRMEALGRFCRGRGISYLAASAEQPFDAVVLRLLRTGGLGA